MSAISKAIAAFVSSLISLLLAIGWITPSLAETLGPEFATAIAVVIGTVITTGTVYFSPKNRE